MIDDEDEFWGLAQGKLDATKKQENDDNNQNQSHSTSRSITP